MELEAMLPVALVPEEVAAPDEAAQEADCGTWTPWL